MKFLIISDGHGDTEKLKALEAEAKNVSGIIYAGDFAAFQKPETGLPFLQALVKLHKHIFAVLGNCDPPEFLNSLEDAGISIEGKTADFNGLVFAGSGGGSKFTGTTPYERTDEELVGDLAPARERAKKEGGFIKNLVLVCHNPPHGVKTDRINPLVHVGSKLIKEFVLKYRPVLVVSGHIHEAFAADTVGETVLVNPGALFEDRYALAEFVPDADGLMRVSVELKTL